jgi:hypothetical protein
MPLFYSAEQIYSAIRTECNWEESALCPSVPAFTTSRYSRMKPVYFGRGWFSRFRLSIYEPRALLSKLIVIHTFSKSPSSE